MIVLKIDSRQDIWTSVSASQESIQDACRHDNPRAQCGPPNNPAPPDKTSRRGRRPARAAVVFIFFLQVAWAMKLATPWYMPIGGTVAALMVSYALTRRRSWWRFGVALSALGWLAWSGSSSWGSRRSGLCGPDRAGTARSPRFMPAWPMAPKSASLISRNIRRQLSCSFKAVGARFA